MAKKAKFYSKEELTNLIETKDESILGYKFYAILKHDLSKVRKIEFVSFACDGVLVSNTEYDKDNRRIAKKYGFEPFEKIQLLEKFDIEDVFRMSKKKKKLVDKKEELLQRINSINFIECWNNTSDEFKTDEFTTDISNVLLEKGMNNTVFIFKGNLYAMDLANQLLSFVREGLISVDPDTKKIISIKVDDKMIFGKDAIYKIVKKLYSLEEFERGIKIVSNNVE